jgi:Uma2 family endonuclease
MSSVTSATTRRYTVADLDDFPDDGNRYELFDGELVVTPPPGERHQWVAQELWRRLERTAPDEYVVFALPVALDLSERTHLEPDLTVKRREDFGRSTFVPLLVVEVASPSTRSRDRRQKRDHYESVGCPAYWLLDPGGPDAQPVLTVLELGPDGRYREVTRVRGAEPYDAARPFPVRVVPADLVSGIPPGG